MKYDNAVWLICMYRANMKHAIDDNDPALAMRINDKIDGAIMAIRCYEDKTRDEIVADVEEALKNENWF